MYITGSRTGSMMEKKVELATAIKKALTLANERGLVYVVAECEKSYSRYQYASAIFHSTIDGTNKPVIRYVVWPESILNAHIPDNDS